jgi:hypothetical protein
MRLSRVFSAVLFVALTAFTASAYTIVMRDGRRVEIPNDFTVTQSTLTYQAGQEIQITIQLNMVDIPATERVNSEQPGALLLRTSALKKPAPANVQARPRAQRSITNKDLEGYRRAREQSEQEYEKRRIELGLPSLEERRQEAAEIQERTREQLLSMRAQEQNDEQYWRSRATPLRTELAATLAQIDFLRRRIDEISSTNSFGVFSTGVPFGTIGGSFIDFPFQSGITPNVFGPSLVDPGFRARFGFNSRFGFGFGNRRPRFVAPGQSRTHGPINRGGRFHRGGRGGRGFSSFVDGGVLAVPFQSWDNDVQQAELIGELDELLMHNVGLQARWRDLENEARTAGVYPGWLRP